MNEAGGGCGEKPQGPCLAAAEQSAQAKRTLSTAITWRDVLGGWGVRLDDRGPLFDLLDGRR